jgi:uncharacterized protein YbaR (Trm112 family)
MSLDGISMTRRYDSELIRQLYRRGVNISDWVRNDEGSLDSSLTAILYSYDAQAGSYIDALQQPNVASVKHRMGEKLASILEGLAPETLLDAGVGEATTLVPVIRAMKRPPPSIWGVDLSLSRLLFARRHLVRSGIEDVQLFTGSLDNLPMSAGSMDVVLTVHAVEPNRGREKDILSELLRVAGRYLVMIEPSYELGNDVTRARIERHRYVRGIPDVLNELAAKVVRYERWGIDVNPANEAALIVVELSKSQTKVRHVLVSPLSGRPLHRLNDCLYCHDDGHAFPIVQDIPCLAAEHAILASKLGDFADAAQTTMEKDS